MKNLPPLTLLIKPSGADCNLRCDYCFYLEKSELYPQTGPHRMTEVVLEQLVRDYMALELPVYSFCWQGGEPTLMGLDFFRQVTELQQAHGRARRVVANSLQTNGILLDAALADHLARYQFLIGYSIDGPAALHDEYRRTGDRRGTHAQVLRGLSLLRERGVAVNALTVVSQANVSASREVYDYLCDLGFDFLQFIPCVEFDAAGQRQPYSLTAAQWGEFLCGIFDRWWEDGPGRITVRLFDALMTKLALGQDTICTFGGDCRQYLVIEHNGDVFPCDFYVLPDQKLGNIMTDALGDIQTGAAFARFGGCKQPTVAPCLACRYLDLCGGDCPVHRTPVGYPATAGSWLCEGWLRFFDHALPRLQELVRGEMARRGRVLG